MYLPFQWGKWLLPFGANSFLLEKPRAPGIEDNSYRKNSKIWDTSNNCHNCPKNRKV